MAKKRTKVRHEQQENDNNDFITFSSSSVGHRNRRPSRRGLENEARMTVEDAGCFHNTLYICSNILLACHLVTGLSLLGYSVAIYVNHHSSEQYNLRAFPSFLIVWSSLLLLAGSTGLHGLHSSLCRRYGLLTSAYIGIALSMWNLVLLIFFLIRKEAFLQYLRRREFEFYLTESKINAFDQHSTVWILLILAFAIVEFLRFYIMRNLRSDLLFHDDANLDAQLRNDIRRRNLHVRLWKTTAQRGNSLAHEDDETMVSSQPLLMDDNQEVENDEDRFNVKDSMLQKHDELGGNDNLDFPSKPWWEDSDSESSSSESREKSRWFLNWRSPKQKFARKKNNLSVITRNAPASHDEGESLSSNDFAPVDEDICIGSSGDKNGPDISWVNDD